MEHSQLEQKVRTGFYSNVFKALRAVLTRRIRIDCDSIPFYFDRIPLSKILNWILVETSVYAESLRPWGFPTHLQIEPANRCNLRCALCPIASGMGRPSGIMDPALFRRIMDEAGNHALLLMLWDWGEPFVNPNLCDMISYAKQKGMKVLTSTNGHFFRTDGQAAQLVRSGLDALIIAVDGISQETYQRYRESGDLETVVQGIRRIVAAKKAAGSSTPLLNLRFVVMKHNEHEIPGLRDFARSLGVDLLTLRALHPHDAKGLLKGEAKNGEYLPQNPDLQRYRKDAKGDGLKRRSHNPCRKLWNSTTIHWNGKVSPCCFDPHDRFTLGDLNGANLRAIWKGPRYHKMRREFRRGYRDIEVCRDCTYAFEGGSLGTEDILEAYFIEAG